METKLFIDEDGKISCVYQDEISSVLRDLGSLTNMRACFVEPCCYDPSKWKIVATPILTMHPPVSGNYRGSDCVGVFDTRAEALKIEAEWLHRYLSTFHFCIWNYITKKFE